MFSEDAFANLTFADLTVVIGFVYYAPNRMETRVILVSIASGYKIRTTITSNSIKEPVVVSSPLSLRIKTYVTLNKQTENYIG